MQSSGSRLFSLLWAFAVVSSLATSLDFAESPSGLALGASLVLSAGVILFRTGAAWVLSINSLLWLAFVALSLPALPNHRLVLALIAATTLTGGFLKPATPDADWRRRQSTMRGLLVIVYLFAVAAKLNTTYFEVERSCAAKFMRESLLLHGIITGSAHESLKASVAIWWGIAGEALVVLLLLMPRARSLGVLLGVSLGMLLHLSFATSFLQHFQNFSAVMLVLLAAWLNEAQARRVLEQNPLLWRMAPWLASMVFGSSLLESCGLMSFPSALALRYTSFLVFYGWLLVAIVVALTSRRAAAPAEAPDGGRRSAVPPFWPILALALMNGMCPYLGVKTRSSFSMYSNLRIDARSSNHLFMPTSPDSLGFLSDTGGELSDGSGSPVMIAGQPVFELPYIAICAYIAGMEAPAWQGSRPSSLSFVRYGVRRSVRPGDPLPPDCPGWLARKLLFFAPVGPASEALCVW